MAKANVSSSISDGGGAGVSAQLFIHLSTDDLTFLVCRK